MGTMVTNKFAERRILEEILWREERRKTMVDLPVYQYRNDPVGFVRKCIKGAEPTSYQEEILVSLCRDRRISVRGPHGLGKTADMAWAVLWFALTRDKIVDWKIITTASAWRQVTVYLWPEIHKWARKIRWDRIGRPPFTEHELLDQNLKLQTGAASAVVSNRSDFIEGAHAEEILYIFDEAKAIPGETWDAAEGAFANGEAYAIASSTPGQPSGRFYDIHKRTSGYEDWKIKHVSKEEAIEAGRINPRWVEQRKKQWGVDSPVYKNRVEGEFAASTEDSVIPFSWVEQAIERWHEMEEGVDRVLGVDVARSGKDETIVAIRQGEKVTNLVSLPVISTMETVGHVVKLIEDGKAIVDVVGIGAGVVDRLQEQGLMAIPFNAGEGSKRTDRAGLVNFADRRSEAWWTLRERLDPETGDDIGLPPDDKMIGDLCAPSWNMTSTGKIKVESKDSIQKHLSRSTDRGDAVVQVFWEPVREADFVFI